MKQETDTNRSLHDVNCDIRKEREPFFISTVELSIPDQNVISKGMPPGHNDIWSLCKPASAVFENGIIIYLRKLDKLKILNIEFSLLLVNIMTDQYEIYENAKLADKEVNETDPKHNLLLFHYHKTDTRSYFTVSGFGPLYKENAV
uniref:Uncharacterized protein n=1 Tax=Pithovirus LCPAC202 TaxID=2506592 RepID=A0A481Z645_9VIRU|nr:MAG: hypothetical protein LCPAC202_03270 [Pithovirus LCPAC202]